MKYETCMKYKCKLCPAYINCEKLVKMQDELTLLYKPFENLKEILRARRENNGKKNQSY